MNYGDFCTGLSAATVAWHSLGWKPQFFSEISPFPCKLLKHHYPHIPNLGDMNKLHENETFLKSNCDVFVAGTPCQSFSVAGLREGLDSGNGNLSRQYIRLLKIKLPPWFVWENVPGVFSSGKTDEGEKCPGRDFAAMLSGWTGRDIAPQKFATVGIIPAATESDYSVAWRVFDSQYFGVPQRRRRVFVIGHIGTDWRPLAAVLFEQESLRRDFTPGKKKGEDIAGTIKASASRSRGAGTDPGMIIGTLSAREKGGGYPGTDEAISGHVIPVAYNVSFNDVNGRRKDRPNGGLYVNKTDISNVVTSAGVGETLIIDNIQFAGSFWDGSQTCQTLDAVLHKGQTMPEKNRFPAVITPLKKVRRLTPLECERLQGFPDYYTNIPGASDSARYEALGNSKTIQVVHWIGWRIDQVQRVLNDLKNK